MCYLIIFLNWQKVTLCVSCDDSKCESGSLHGTFNRCLIPDTLRIHLSINHPKNDQNHSDSNHGPKRDSSNAQVHLPLK